MSTGHRCLLAVDLGLSTGFAAFDDRGRLRRVGSQHLGRRGQVRGLAARLRRELGRVDALVLEGDRDLAAAWRRELEPRGAEVLHVTPEDWREALLHPRERRDGATAKQVARQLAGQAVKVLGGSSPPRLRHDAAEAVLIGVYGLVALGWVPALPAPLDPRRR